MADTEKITINMSVVDLGKIDLLVDHGFYSSRSDLIRTAIREKLAKHEEAVEQEISRRSMTVGISLITRSELEKLLRNGVTRQYLVVGLLSIAQDVTPELAAQTIDSLRVYGVLRASEQVKKALADRIQ